jgi:hypothetical protein
MLLLRGWQLSSRFGWKLANLVALLCISESPAQRQVFDLAKLTASAREGCRIFRIHPL